MKKKIGFIAVTLLIVVTFYAIFKQTNINQMKNIIQKVNIYYLAIGLGCMLLFWLIESFLISKLLKKIAKKRRTKWIAIKTTLIGQYYSLITPFASGGQPAQLYQFKKEDISIGNGTAVLVAKFLLFQISVTLYSLGLWVVRFNYLDHKLSMAKSFVFTGLVLNSIGLTLIVLLAFKPNQLEKLIKKILLLLEKIKIIKNSQNKIDKADKIISDYEKGIHYLKEDFWYTFKMFLYSFVQLTVFFSITFFIYKSLGLSGTSILDIITLQALLYMAVSFIPIPGTIGASEIGFSMIFISAFSTKFVPVALILWRGISYYFGLIFCGGFTLWVYLQNQYLPRTQ